MCAPNGCLSVWLLYFDYKDNTGKTIYLLHQSGYQPFLQKTLMITARGTFLKKLWISMHQKKIKIFKPMSIFCVSDFINYIINLLFYLL